MRLAEASPPAGEALALLRQRPALADAFAQAWAALAGTPHADAWTRAVVGMLRANAGAACLLGLFRLQAPPATLTNVAVQSLAILRHAGAAASVACLQRWDALRNDDLWPGWVRLAQDAPDCLPPAAAHAAQVLDALGPGGFMGFVNLGLKATGRDKTARAAFFALTHPLARRTLANGEGGGFAVQERRLKLFGTAVWGRVPALRALPAAEGRPPPRRASLSDGVVLLPPNYPGVPAAAQPALYRAAVAHALAHLLAGAPRMRVEQLKPLQLAVIGLIEDARVETLALRRYPGLRRFWAPFHTAEPFGTTVPDLLARMARALFDPRYADPNGWVVKARTLVAAADPLDATASRRIGGLLGNDLGQMRVQFNARTYIIEPAYRDDGLGLWDFGAQTEAPPEVIEMMVEAARIRQEAGGERNSPQGEATGTARARPAAAREPEGAVLARYPEWDAAQGIDRPDWTTVRAVPPPAGDPHRIDAALDAAPDLRRRIDRLVRAARPGRPQRLKQQPDGMDLDMDAVLAAVIEQEAGELPSERLYRSTALKVRDLATVVLVDVSQSTSDGGVLETERAAVALLAGAMQQLGDPFALLAFASDGRERVNLMRIKDFSEPYGPAAQARLAGLTPGLSTRLGAALRHAGAELAGVRSFRKLMLVLTDGEPSDIDVPNPQDLTEDARRAVLGLRARGIDPFGVVFSPQSSASAERIFGRSGQVTLRRLEDLPARLSDLYFRLSRR